ncbi:MAG: acyl-CoA dehydrogenase family protein [Polyangiaceae bacterium]|nr:acyl-CoA dehydrogenase family protein [Polyangiaceae bacterium]
MTESSARVVALKDPQLRSFLPLLYVASADQTLSEGERRALTAKIAAMPWLRPAAREAAESWLNPNAPATEEEFQDLTHLLAGIAKTASARARSTFHALANELASSPEHRKAVDELAALLGTDVALPEDWEASHQLLESSFRSDARQALELGRFLDGRHQKVREEVREFLDAPELRCIGLGSEETREHTREQLARLARTGLLHRAFPGVTCEGDLGEFMALFEELGHGNLSLTIKMGVQAGLYGGAIWALGTARHHHRLAQVASLEEMGCFAMSEVGHGSNVAQLETVARYVHETREFIVTTPGESARKDWIGGAAHDARFAVVFAQLEVQGVRHGVHALIVPIRTPDGAPLSGVRTGDCGHKMGLNGVDNGRLWFENVRVPVDNLLDRFASVDGDGQYQSPIDHQGRRFFTMLATLVGGRICVGSSAVSAARSGLAIAIRYATMRRQFSSSPSKPERTLLTYPSHQRRLLPQLATNVVLRMAFEKVRVRHGLAMVEEEGKRSVDPRKLEAEVAILKVLGSRHGVDAIQAAREACGGQGYLSINRIATLRTDVEIFTTFEGDNVVLSQLVTKALLSEYRGQFEDEDYFSVARILGRRVLERAVTKNPVAVRLRDPAHLRSRQFQLETLQYREDHVIETLAARLSSRLRSGLDMDTAFLQVQEHVLAASEAFGERLAFESFVEYEDEFLSTQKVSEQVKEMVKLLGDAYALGTVESHAAWYLEDGYVESGKSRAIRIEHGKVLSELAPHARTVVDAFQIPDACLAAPIAFFDPAHPKYQ